MNVIQHPATIITPQYIEELKKRIKSNHVNTIKALRKLDSETPPDYKHKAVRKVRVMWNGEKEGEEIALMDGPMCYRLTLKYLITGSNLFADKTLEIVEAWIDTCTECSGDNAQLSASWSQVNFARCVELLSHFYNNDKVKRIKKKYLEWYDRVMSPAVEKQVTWKFQIGSTGSYDTYTNWHVAILEAKLQVALLRDDIKTVQESLQTFKKILPEIIEKPFKLCNETIYRDVMHGCMSLGSLVNIAEIAWHQGVDLYSFKDNLLRDAIEATAAICIGELPKGLPVPTLNKVQYWPYCWYISYHHYVHRKKMAMPETKKLINLHPVDYSWLFSSSCALTHVCST